MKKLLSYVALVAISFGFSVSAFAADTLVASGGYGATAFTASGCSWVTDYVIPTAGGVVTGVSLKCSGSSVAAYEFIGINSGGATINSTNANYYAAKREGGTGANTYNYSVYKKAYICQSGAYNSAVYAENNSASSARGMTAYYYPNACGGSQEQCPLNVKAVSGGYQLWCGM